MNLRALLFEIEFTGIFKWDLLYYDIVDCKYCYHTVRKQNVRIGRVLTTFYPELSPADVTHWCEKIAGYFYNDKVVFKILEGEDIRDAYYTGNYYAHTGMLGNSCMRYKYAQKYLDVYVDHAKMLVMVPKRGKRIQGRAILWDYNGTYAVDRIYGINNAVFEQFKQYARDNKWYILRRNCYVDANAAQRWLTPESNYNDYVELDITIKLSKHYKYMPYIDSVTYLDGHSLTSIPPYDGAAMCHCTNGNIWFQ